MTTNSDASTELPDPLKDRTCATSAASGRGFCEQLLHLLALNAFAVGQPILAKLSGNLQYLRHEDFSGTVILISMGVLFLLLPMSVSFVVAVCKMLKRQRASEVVFRSAILGYGILIGLLICRWLSAQFRLLDFGLSDLTLLPAGIAIGTAMSWCYRRFASFRQSLSLSAAGVLLFPAGFFAASAAREVVFDLETSGTPGESRAGNPTPIVMIVFDGMTGMSLLNAAYEIDSVRYPNFARLAEQSTFFRNATTVHTRTDHALPAMLASVYPEESWLPIESYYPGNLIRLLHNSRQFDLTVFEPYTRLSPIELRDYEMVRSPGEQMQTLANVICRLYLNLTFPRDLIDISIPRPWFGLSPVPLSSQKYMRGSIVYPFDQDRTEQANHFVSTLRATEKPGAYFLHLAVPHYPWSLLPDGRSCVDPYGQMLSVPGVLEEQWCNDEWPVNLCWQRNLLQTQFADRLIGQVLDRLEELSIFDSAMVIVTADHGIAFRPGQPMRELTDVTKGDLLSVPLFIKLPNQSNGAITDTSVETIDILPTIAEVLELPALSDWQGTSVFSDEPRLRKTIAGPTPAILEADFSERFQYVDRMVSVFGDGRHHDRLGTLNDLPFLTGQSVAVLTGPPSHRKCRISGGSFTSSDVFPCLLTGTFLSKDSLLKPIQVAVAVDGKIAVTTRTSLAHDDGNVWTAFIPPSILEESSEKKVTCYEIRKNSGTVTLHEINQLAAGR